MQNPNSASWLKIQVDSVFIEQSVWSQKPKWTVTAQTKTIWAITLLCHISLYTTVLVFLHSYQLQERKTRYSKKKNSKHKTGINYNEGNMLFIVQNRYQLQWRKYVIHSTK